MKTKKPQSLQVLAAKLNDLAARQCELEREQIASFGAFLATYVAAIKADGEADVEIPDLPVGQRQNLERKAQLARQHFELEPDFQQALRQQRELDAENARRLGSAA